MLEQLMPLLPEVYLAGLVLFTLIVGMFSKEETSFKNTYIIALSGLAGVLIIMLAGGVYEEAFTLAKQPLESLFITHEIAAFTKFVVLICGIILLLISKVYLENHQLLKFEYNVLFLAAVLGGFVALSSMNLLVVYIGLELLSFSTYVLVGFNHRSTKALISANKYFIVGSVSSALMLYGISLLYITTGSVSYETLGLHTFRYGIENLSFEVYLALVLVASGLFFKIAIVPLQFYLRDVLYATNRPMLGFISTITKVVGLIVLFSMLAVILPSKTPDMYYNLMLSFALITIFIGSVAALRENNINRLLAYSSINNAGFMLIGASLLDLPVTAVYIINYCVIILAIVCFILSYKVRGEYIRTIQDLALIAKQNHKFAVLGVFLFFTLAGVPPFMLFYAKFLVIKSLLISGFTISAVLAVIFSVFAVAYCLRIIKYIYLSPIQADVSIQAVSSAKLMTYLFAIVVFVLSIFPDLLFRVM